MDAIDQNRIAIDMRDELYSAKQNKRRYWIYKNQENVDKRLNSRVIVVKTK